MDSIENNKTILLVEDNLAQIRLVQEVLKGTEMLRNLAVVRNGIDAMTYLRNEGEYVKASRPAIVLLDLNMPKKDGRELLAEIKIDPNLKSIPVLVLTTSNKQDDVRWCYDSHANCYIRKSGNLESLFNCFQKIERFWFDTATLPPFPKQMKANQQRIEKLESENNLLQQENYQLKEEIQDVKNQLQQVEHKLDLILDMLQNKL